MSKRILSLSALLAFWVVATVLVLTSTVAAASQPPQRVMLVQKHRFGDPQGTFSLYALTPGALDFDSGTFRLAAAERPFIVRRGQRIAVYVAVETLSGERGRLDLRWRVEFVGAGDGTTVGTGTWSVAGGRGAYAGTTGGGRLAAVVMNPRGLTSAQFEGFLRAPPT